MRITWFPSESGRRAFVLGDNTDGLRGAGSRVINAVVPAFQQAIDDAALLGSQERGLDARGNWAVAVTLQCTYEFASIDECRLFTCDLGAQFVGNGSLRLLFEGGSQRTLNGAVCERIAIEGDFGMVATVTYSFRGENLTA